MVEVDDSVIAPVEEDRGEVESARVGLESMALHERMRGSDDAPLLRRARHGQWLGQGRAAPSPAFDFEEHHRVQFHENGIDFMTVPSPVRGQKLPRRRDQGLQGPGLSASSGLGAAFQNHMAQEWGSKLRKRPGVCGCGSGIQGRRKRTVGSTQDQIRSADDGGSF